MKENDEGTLKHQEGRKEGKNTMAKILKTVKHTSLGALSMFFRVVEKFITMSI